MIGRTYNPILHFYLGNEVWNWLKPATDGIGLAIPLSTLVSTSKKYIQYRVVSVELCQYQNSTRIVVE